MIPHRSTALLSVIVFVALLLFIFSSSPIPDAGQKEEVTGPAKFVPTPKLPSLSNFHLPSFRPPSHEQPEEQSNSTHGESKWYSTLEWLNPFSSSITLDENRSVLPPFANDLKESQNADAQLLLAWRRAWFAQGFRPVVLTPGDAMKNPNYEVVQKWKLTPKMENEVFSWLAWGHMGTGLLADFHCFPMARYDDPILMYLRRGTVPELITRFENLKNGLYAADKSRIDVAVQSAVLKLTDQTQSFVDLIEPESFKVESPSALAFYKSAAVTSNYPIIHEKMGQNAATGQLALVQLINSHLHNQFHISFPAGIAVLKPFPQHTTALVEPALRLAKALIECPESPMPESCPPNQPECHPCGAAKQPMRISQPPTYKNTTFLFTIGTLPHPYTLISLQRNSEEITVPQIRRETTRDAWLSDVTKEHLGLELGSSYRGVIFKQVVAGEDAVGNSLWMTVESLSAQAGQSLPGELLDEFEWQFGFKIPRGGRIDPATENNKETAKSAQDHTPSEQGVGKEYELIQKARDIIKNKNTDHNIKDVVEAWNLADTEVWRFVKAYRARSVVERRKWEEEEKAFAGSRP
ncbi:hypothetical protein N7457_007095 [Penicillium paradoxum]|uniref:uncharacterized protein n=1 Tax=Penicillium paradoxum TaxID=176176 RepID=UPI0025489970|nr:uncharacterized protein N7457_007095 [Penicillium paradoxum]KAJ5779375.1 hypothetical protein N7457_007095 [Penicillium paradoxum]